MEPIALLEAAIAEYREASAGAPSPQELRRLRAAMDSLEESFCSKARMFQLSGGHLAEGAVSVVAWLRNNCKMSGTSAADRVCVGKELESLPRIAQALASGEIGYQSTAVLCHLREQLDEKPSSGCSVATPAVPPTPTASAAMRSRTSSAGGCTSARWRTACT